MEELYDENRQSENVTPYNIDAEKSVLGAALMSSDAVDKMCETLIESDFYLSQHKSIFVAIQSLYIKGSPVDTITTANALEVSGKLKDVGGMSYITELSIFMPTAANVSYYIDIIKEYGVRRRLATAADSIAKDALNTEMDTQMALNNAERRIFEIMTNKSDNSLAHVSETLPATHRRIGEYISLGNALSGMPTGFSELDRVTSGLQKSNLIIVAARPSMGKSAFALNIATNVALRGKGAVAIFSLEMSVEEVELRMMCSEALVSMQNVKTGSVSADELLKLSEALTKLERSQIYIDETASISVPEIRSKCRRLKARSGLDLIVIDYLGLMQSTKKFDNRVLEVSELTRSLKILARELEVPIILLSQLSREPEKRKENPRPIMSDLRDSGAIEQDADIIMMLYRPAVYGKSDDNSAEVILAKNRNGPTQTINVVWLPEYTRFTDMAYEY